MSYRKDENRGIKFSKYARWLSYDGSFSFHFNYHGEYIDIKFKRGTPISWVKNYVIECAEDTIDRYRKSLMEPKHEKIDWDSLNLGIDL